MHDNYGGNFGTRVMSGAMRRRGWKGEEREGELVEEEDVVLKINSSEWCYTEVLTYAQFI